MALLKFHSQRACECIINLNQSTSEIMDVAMSIQGQHEDEFGERSQTEGGEAFN